MHPYLLHLGSLAIPSFGVLAAVGLMLALALSERTARLTRIQPEALWNAGLFAVLAAFLLSRLLLIASHWRAFVTYPLLLLTVPSLTAGGLLFTVLAVLLWLWSRNIPILSALDAWAPCATLVWFFLALGHFAEGSDPGLPSVYGIVMPGESTPLYPVPLYAAAVAALLTPLLFFCLRRPRRPGDTAGLALFLTGVTQFLLTFLRQPGLELHGLEALEWTALAMIVAGALLVAASRPVAQA